MSRLIRVQRKVSSGGGGGTLFPPLTGFTPTATVSGVSEFGTLAGVTSSSHWGFVLANNDCIYGVPYGGTFILKIDTASDTLSSFGTFSSGGFKWVGGCLAPNGCIYCIPNSANEILKIDPSNDTYTTFGSGTVPTGNSKYRGGVLASDGCIYCVNYGSYNILKIDTNNDTVSTPITRFGTLYRGACIDSNDNIYFAPGDNSRIVQLDIVAETATGISVSRTDIFGLALAPNGKMYGTTNTSGVTGFTLEVTPSTGAFVNNKTGIFDSESFGGFVTGPNGKLYSMAEDTNLWEYDPTTDSVNLISSGFTVGLSSIYDAVLAPNGAIYQGCSSTQGKLVRKIQFNASLSAALCRSAYFNKL